MVDSYKQYLVEHHKEHWDMINTNKIGWADPNNELDFKHSFFCTSILRFEALSKPVISGGFFYSFKSNLDFLHQSYEIFFFPIAYLLKGVYFATRDFISAVSTCLSIIIPLIPLFIIYGLVLAAINIAINTLFAIGMLVRSTITLATRLISTAVDAIFGEDSIIKLINLTPLGLLNKEMPAAQETIAELEKSSNVFATAIQ